MREIVKIRVSVATLTRQSSSPVDEPYWAFEKLKNEFGEFVDSRTGIFRYEGEAGSEQTTEIVDLLESIGVVLIWELYPFSPESDGHQIEGRREFDSEDFQLANYFVLLPTEEIARPVGQPADDGTLGFEVKKSARGKMLGYAQFGGVYCTVRMRSELESHDFKGLAFRKTGNPKSGILELSSSMLLPPVLNDVVDEESGKCLSPSERRCCGIQDIFLPHQPRFPESAFINDFDVARTTETWHWPTMCHVARPWIIVSRRFKNWCDEMSFQIDWIPVVGESQSQSYT